MEWYNSLDPLLKAYWAIALVTSLVFIIQTIMTFIGMDSTDGLHADFNGGTDMEGPFQLFSLRNLINFLLGYGWAGICFYNQIHSVFWLNAVAIGVGLLFVLLFFILIAQIKKLAKDNTFHIRETSGHVADVYLAIPGGKTGKGKIQISIRGAFHEIDAMTEGEKIPTGGKARVESIIDDQTVMVVQI